MFNTLPKSAAQVRDWIWESYEPYYNDLQRRDIDEQWLKDWSAVHNLAGEVGSRLYVGTTVDTADKDTENRFNAYLEGIHEKMQAADQALKEKLLLSGYEPEGFEVPIKNMRTQAALYRDENLPLMTEDSKLSNEYSQVRGAQLVEWDGQELTMDQMDAHLLDPDRAVREKAWRLKSERMLKDRQVFNDQWPKFFDIRTQIARNAGMNDFRAYSWESLLRFDYTPVDCSTFHSAIEQVVVPAAKRIYERRQQQLGLESLRPWDLAVDPYGLPPLKPFKDSDEMIEKSQAVFDEVDPELGVMYATMVREDLLDLASRKNKAPGGYCISYETSKRPFIFMNAVGLHDDLQTLLHECGHAFHCFEASRLPYFQQGEVGSEFAEVASMSMELIAAPFLTNAGFYSPSQNARASVKKLQEMILFWPYMAVVDAFQHWAYTNPLLGRDPDKCDGMWTEIWNRFMPGVDFSGFEDVLATGWHRKLHIFTAPFYYVEYGLAQVGAIQVWKNSLSNRSLAVRNYRKALSLGGTKPLPELFQTAGGRFAFDAGTLGELVDLVEEKVSELEGQIS